MKNKLIFILYFFWKIQINVVMLFRYIIKEIWYILYSKHSAFYFNIFMSTTEQHQSYFWLNTVYTSAFLKKYINFLINII